MIQRFWRELHASRWKVAAYPVPACLQCQSTVDTVSGTGASPDGVSRSLTCAFFVHLKFIESRSA